MDNIAIKLKTWAATNYGMNIADHQIDAIIDRVNHLMMSRGMTESDYLSALNTPENPIIAQTIEAITVQESYFFRDSSLFNFLKNKLFPSLISEKRKQDNCRFNIWSAGCANGEEIYSIAIYLHHLLPDIKQWNINLLATDINNQGCEKGKLGVFTKASMRATEDWIIDKYFTENRSVYTLNETIRNMVKFSYGNIAKTQGMLFKFDLILCRNVFIYLNKQTITEALNLFYEQLVDDGVLLLSPADLCSYITHKFSTQIVDEICLLKREIPKKQIITPPRKEEKTDDPGDLEIQKERSQKLDSVRLSLGQKKYSEVLLEVDSFIEKCGGTAPLYRYKGEALLGLGDKNTALIYLTKAIKLDPSDAIGFFLKGLIEVDMKAIKYAEMSLKKALAIKPDFPEASYYLGLNYLQNKQKQQGLASLLKALQDAKKLDRDKIMLFSDATATQFIEAVNSSLLYYQGIKND